MVIVVGPCACQGCGEPVSWARLSTRTDDLSTRWREADGHIHRCQNTRSFGAPSRYNDRGGSSTESNRIATVARVSATTRDAGDVASIEVVAR